MTDTLTLPARAFGKAWSRVLHAASTDPKDVHYHRTIFVEIFDEGVRLVCTNRYVLLRAWVSTVDADGDPVHPEPDLDAEPRESLFARDVDFRGRGLAKYMADRDLDVDEPGSKQLKVALHVGELEDELQPVLGVDLAQHGLVIAYTDERVVIPILEGIVPPPWRALYTGFLPGQVEVMTFSTSLFAIIGRLTGASRSVQLDTSGPNRPVLFTLLAASPPISGLIAPERTETEPAESDELPGATIIPWNDDDYDDDEDGED